MPSDISKKCLKNAFFKLFEFLCVFFFHFFFVASLKKEVECLMDLVKKHGKKWERIGFLMNRTGQSCCAKFRELEKKSSMLELFENMRISNTSI